MSESARSLWSLAGFVAMCLLVEFVSARATSLSVSSWYVDLQKPVWTPPGWVFPIAWTLLYLSMGVAAWMVWQVRSTESVGLALTFFGVQLFLNLLWSMIFFGMRQIGWGLVDISLLWLSIAGTIVAFYSVRPSAALLMIPYLMWVSYATALNFTIWKLNR
jgi:benzodiazapine receptor